MKKTLGNIWNFLGLTQDRIGRRKFLVASLAVQWGLPLVVSLVMGLFYVSLKEGNPLLFLPAIAFFASLVFGVVVYIKISIRRVRDIGIAQGWWVLAIIPLINIPFFVYLCLKGGGDGRGVVKSVKLLELPFLKYLNKQNNVPVIIGVVVLAIILFFVFSNKPTTEQTQDVLESSNNQNSITTEQLSISKPLTYSILSQKEVVQNTGYYILLDKQSPTVEELVNLATSLGKDSFEFQYFLFDDIGAYQLYKDRNASVRNLTNKSEIELINKHFLGRYSKSHGRNTLRLEGEIYYTRDNYKKIQTVLSAVEKLWLNRKNFSSAEFDAQLFTLVESNDAKLMKDIKINNYDSTGTKEKPFSLSGVVVSTINDGRVFEIENNSELDLNSVLITVNDDFYTIITTIKSGQIIKISNKSLVNNSNMFFNTDIYVPKVFHLEAYTKKGFSVLDGEWN